MSKLTNKQAAFCREYIKDCNGTAAAKRRLRRAFG